MRSLHKLTAVFLTLLATSCSESSDDDDQNESTVFTLRAELLDETGAASFSPLGIFVVSSGRLLVRDGVSDAIVLIQTDGEPGLWVAEDEIADVTGRSSASIGPLDQVFLGALDGQIIAADAVSGLIIRFSTTGVPSVHSTEDQITDVTGETEARMLLPRALLANQIISQDAVSGHILLIGNSGAPSPTPFVDIADIADASGLDEADAFVSQWVRGASSGAQFGRFDAGPVVVRVRVSGQIDTWVTEEDLEDLFPDVAGLRILDMVADVDSDALLLLIGRGARGVAVAVVNSSGDVSEFTAESELIDSAGTGFDIRDLGVLASGLAFGVDAGNEQIVVFGSGGTPSLLADRDEIEDAAGTGTPSLKFAAPLGATAIAVFESTEEVFLRVR